MVIERVPKLNIRPKHLVKVYASNLDSPIPLLRNISSVSATTSVLNGRTVLTLTITEGKETKPYTLDLVQVGTIQSITLTTDRGVGFYRNLDYQNLGKIRETYPHLPNYSASVKNVAFYSQHLLNAFQATKQGDVFTKLPEANPNTSIDPTFNIYNQIAPLIIKVDMLEKGGDNQDKVRSLILWDCWFDKSEIEFSIEEDIFLVQEAGMKFAWLMPVSA